MIIGITGMPTVGKDTFFKYFCEWLSCEKVNYTPARISFADAIRKDLKDFVQTNYDINIYTCKGEEKEIIRPLMIAHGFAMRQLQPNCWIDKTKPIIKEYLESDLIPVFTDVRYVNEIALIQKSGGMVLHVVRESGAPYPEPDSVELLECFERCDATFHLQDVNMNQEGHKISEDYIDAHQNLFLSIEETLNKYFNKS